jgi:hypothetical protein
MTTKAKSEKEGFKSALGRGWVWSSVMVQGPGFHPQHHDKNKTEENQI